MPRVESIRPGEVLESDLAEYPLPELLLGILRGNLTGPLELDLSAAPRNWIHFQDGVPIAVSLPDVPGSLASVLAARGTLDRETAAKVEAEAKKSGKTESAVIRYERILTDGALREGLRIRARQQVAQLFDLVDCHIRFREGVKVPSDAELVVLQLLPILYEGLLRSKNRGAMDRFQARYAQHRFRLSDTYPRGVDPFEWGEQVERRVRAMEQPEGIEDLVQGGLSRPVALAVLAALVATDMAEILEPQARAPREARPDFGASDRAGERPRFYHDQVRTLIAQRLDPLISQSYYELLRLPSSADDDELIRAHRGLIARIDTQDPAGRAHRALIDEAFAVLKDARLGPEYLRANADPERRARIEADPRYRRGVSALVAGELGEAEYWLELAARQDPARKELRPVRRLLALSAADPQDVPMLAAELLPTIEAESHALDPRDLGRGALAVVRAALQDRRQALKILEGLGARGEAWRPWVERLLQA